LKIYVVHHEQGEYDAYTTWIHEVHIDKNKAEESADETNSKMRGREPLMADVEECEVKVPRGYKLQLVEDFGTGSQRRFRK